jgi:hypothetical protein
MPFTRNAAAAGYEGMQEMFAAFVAVPEPAGVRVGVERDGAEVIVGRTRIIASRSASPTACSGACLASRPVASMASAAAAAVRACLFVPDVPADR